MLVTFSQPAHHLAHVMREGQTAAVNHRRLELIEFITFNLTWILRVLFLAMRP
jgi:hypothetical protein